jgi:hypothetical protein
MIGKPIKGSGFRGLLDYLAGRDGAELIGGNMEGRNPRELAREFAFSRALRPRLGKAACHIPLRLPYDERLSVAQWQRIGERIMAGMGFEDCSYAMYLHPQDPQGQHLHIVASRVTHLGHCVDDSFDMERLMRIERRIEKDYGLREVPYRKTAARRPRRGEYQFRERTGQASERERLQEVVGAVARPGLAVDEFVAALERQGVELRPAITSTGRVNGMRYRRGEVTFSGSSLGADFTWPGLLERRGLAFEAARDLPALVGAGRRFDAGALGAVIANASAEGPAAMRVAAGAAGGGAADGGPPAGGGSRSGGEVSPPEPDGSPPEADVSPRLSLASLPAPIDDWSLASQISEGAMATDRSQQADRIDAGDAGGAETPDPAGRIGEGAAIAGGGGIGGGAGNDGQGAGSSPRGAGRGRRPDTADQVARQLAALGSPRYDVLILEVATGEHLHHRTGLTPPGVAAAIPWLKHLNAYGCEILVRPSAPAGLSHFEGVHLGALREASAAGFEPAAVLRAPDGGREVWMRGGADLPPGVQDLVDRELTRRLRPGRPPQTPGYGHLAGFTSPHAQRAGGLERPPFLTLEEDGGRVYGGFRALAAEARARAAAEVLEQRAEREIAGLGREGSARAEGEVGDLGADAAAAVAPAAVDGTPPRATAARPASRQAALREMLAITDQEAVRRSLAGAPRPPSPAEIEEQLARWTAARQAHAEALAAAGAEVEDGLRGAAPYRLEARVVATYRAQETIRQELAERLGVEEVPAELPAGAALQLARWQASLSGAEERLDRLLLEPGATTSDRLEGAIAVRTLREELADAAREHGLVLREAVPGLAPDVELADAELAGAGLAGAGLAGAEREHGLVQREAVPAAAPAGLAGAGKLMTPAEPVAEGLQPSRGSEGEPEGLEAWAAAGQPAGWPGMRSMETGGLEGLVAAYDDAAISRAAERHAAGWREQLAVELSLEGREAALRVELSALERAHERASLLLDALESRLEREPTSARQAAHATLVGGLMDLEELQVPVAARVAYLANHRLGREMGRLERILEREPTADGIAALTRVLDERRQLAPRREELSAEQAEIRPRGESSEARVLAAGDAGDARDRFERAVEGLLERPSLRAVQGVEDRHRELRAEEDIAGRAAAAGELRAARQALHRAGEALVDAAADRPGEAVGAAEVGPLRRALERYQAAETAVAGRLDAADTAADASRGELGTLVLRLERGDLSPRTLARLQLAIGGRLLAFGESAGPLPRSPEAAGLAEAVAAWKDGRGALQAAMQPFRGNGRGDMDGAALRRLREGVARYQSAAAELDRHVQGAARTPESRALAPRYFLEHAAFSGQPHRAVAAWSAHAAERGIDPVRIPEVLARSGGARMASPRLLSSHYGIFLAAAVSRVGLSMFHHYANEP